MNEATSTDNATPLTIGDVWPISIEGFLFTTPWYENTHVRNY